MKTANLFLTSFLLLLLSFSTTAFAQQKKITATVRDAHSDEPVPFASVLFKDSNIGTLTDSAGTFSFSFYEWPSDSIIISCVGFKTLTLAIEKDKELLEWNITLEAGKFMEGAVVKATVNKGLFVWKKIVQHKPKNDRYRFENFSYEL